MFNKDSIVVQAWVNTILKGDKTIDDIPNLSNLIGIVIPIVEEVEANV